MTENSRDAQAPQYNAAEIGAVAHLYRGEMYRSTVWRTRLDITTNWAVVTTGIALSVTFSSVQATPLPIVLVSFLLAAFLLFEARRYHYFDIWNTRLRVIESCFYDPILRGGGTCTDSDWNEVLADDLRRLRLHMGLLDAVGLRLRRNYGWIFAIQIASYWSKIGVHPTPLASFSDLWERTAVGPVPGQVVLAAPSFTLAFSRSVSSPSVRSTGSNETLAQCPLRIAFGSWPVPSNTERLASLDRAAGPGLQCAELPCGHLPVTLVHVRDGDCSLRSNGY